MNRTEKPERPARIVVSMGDPCGVGPELCLKAAADIRWRERLGAAITVAGSIQVLDAFASRCGLENHFKTVHEPASEPGSVSVIETDSLKGAAAPPGPGPVSGEASIGYIERGVSEVLSGRADAIVTCPISKQALSEAGCPDPGHTEMLGRLSGSGSEPVMMMQSRRLRVAFVTTHLALRDLPGAVTAEKVEHTVKVFADALERYFSGNSGKIAVCALNPHAGDGGRFGTEEQDVLAPALDRLREQGLDIEGPLPADSLFYKALESRYRGVTALYHDQGMIPVKIDGPAEAVNITIGLPLIRTSPAHGTAFDIAGRGVADPASFKNAVSTAAMMVKMSEGKTG